MDRHAERCDGKALETQTGQVQRAGMQVQGFLAAALGTVVAQITAQRRHGIENPVALGFRVKSNFHQVRSGFCAVA